MTNVHLHSIEYFTAPGNYFWKWADNGDVIEWKANSKTICYKQELIDILSEFEESVAPPLSSVILTIAACKADFGKEETAMLRQLYTDTNLQPSNAHDQVFDKATSFLNMLPHLPVKLRTGKARAHLMHLIFRKPNASGFKPVGLKPALEDFTSGQWQYQYLNEGPDLTWDTYHWHLSYFEEAKRETPLFNNLVTVLQTGLSEVPEPVAIDIPVAASGSLFGQLSQHPELSALARLAERIVPVLNIPMHTRGGGQDPFGGISDITNRGSYDKLLLSELAHDDLTLTARLVNGESLYYRREEPPDKPTQKRVILIDTTLRMWGIPRLFSMASALAFAHNLKGREEVYAYMLEGSSWVAANLSEIKGVQLAMGVLHHALHCGVAINWFFTEEKLDEQDEVVLITDAHSFQNAAFMAAYSPLRNRINYTIIVNRSGEIEFRESYKGKSKTLGSAKLSLQDILKEPERVSNVVQALNGTFYSQSPRPLLLAKSVNILPLAYHVCVAGALVINKNNQVLFFSSSSKGAREIMECIEKGEYKIVDSGGRFNILVLNREKGFLKLYVISKDFEEVHSSDLSSEVVHPQTMHVKDEKFYIRGRDINYTITAGKLTKLDKQSQDDFERTADRIDFPPQKNNIYLHQTRRFTNYSPMFRTRNLYINDNNELVFGSYLLTILNYGNSIRFKETTIKPDSSNISADESFYLPQFSQNKKLRFSLRRFKDDSEVQVDPRGLVHLKSADPSLPQVTLVFVSGCNTACWASDGKYCGEHYFHAPHLRQQDEMQAKAFYLKYIQPFIQHIKQHATSNQE